MESVSKLLPLTIKKLGINKRYNAESAIYHWKKIVGEKIAAHTRPLSVQRDLLFVAVSNPVWAHHLSMMKQDIISKINSFIGDYLIKDIRFQAGYLKDNQNEENTSQEQKNSIKLHNIRLDESEQKTIQDIVSAVKDDELRQKLCNVVKSDMAMKKVRRRNKWHKCAKCNALCPPDATYCPVCSIEKKQQIRKEIYIILSENPWLGYSELKKYINCSFEDFKEVKARLIASLTVAISAENCDKIKEMTLVMLATGIKPEQITDALIDNTLKRFRRKKHVSASRG
jgi:Uncharacterized protein conserved in bacteria